MSQGVRISIVTIAFNNERDIGPTLDSVMAQDYPNIEYIVVDGASSDGTLGVIDRYRASIDRFVSEPDDGMYDAINKGIAMATGDVVGLLHAGDRLYSNDVIRSIARAFEDPRVEASYGHSILVNAADRPVRVNRSKPFSRARIRRGWMPSHQSIYMRRDRFERYGGYRNDLGGSGDYEFFVRQFYRHPIRAELIDKYLIRFALGGRSTTNYHQVLERQSLHANCWRMNNLRPPFYLVPCKLVRKIPQFLRGGIARIGGRHLPVSPVRSAD